MKTGKNDTAKIKRFAVFWFDPDLTKGAELRKIRPCVVISPDEMNTHLKTVLVAPLTTTVRPWPFRVTVRVLGQPSSVACDQIRAVDKSRLRERITDLASRQSQKVLHVLRAMFAE
jgi:mRNA interferase MazF